MVFLNTSLRHFCPDGSLLVQNPIIYLLWVFEFLLQQSHPFTRPPLPGLFSSRPFRVWVSGGFYCTLSLIRPNGSSPPSTPEFRLRPLIWFVSPSLDFSGCIIFGVLPWQSRRPSKRKFVGVDGEIYLRRWWIKNDDDDTEGRPSWVRRELHINEVIWGTRNKRKLFNRRQTI